MTRILFITYEHAIGTFSGNGVYATSQTSALESLKHDVVVLSAYSDALELGDDDSNAIRVPVPSSSWDTLHNTCGWKEFADGAASKGVLQRLLDPTTERLRFDIVFTVDWHAALAWQRIRESLQLDVSSCKPRWVFLSYRMFSRDEASSEVIREAEKWAAATAHQTVTLSKSDQSFVYDAGWVQQHRPCPFLPPGIRADVAALPLPADVPESISGSNASQADSHDDGPSLANQWPGSHRNLFLCCVRLSSEKQPHTFVSVAAALSRSGIFQKFALQPLLLAASSSPYAQEIVREFEEKVPEGRVERKFMSAGELAEVFACTVLNFHPCEYDAYGMTVVEAASQGAPSIMHEGETVGATHILNPTRDESFSCNLTAAAGSVAQQVVDILKDRQKCARVSMLAAAAARQYDSTANAKQLMELVQGHVSNDTAPDGA